MQLQSDFYFQLSVFSMLYNIWKLWLVPEDYNFFRLTYSIFSMKMKDEAIFMKKRGKNLMQGMLELELWPISR